MKNCHDHRAEIEARLAEINHDLNTPISDWVFRALHDERRTLHAELATLNAARAGKEATHAH